MTKKDHSIRICVDFRRLNALSEPALYPMPRVDDFIDRVGQARYISALDLSKGYWQVPMSQESKAKTAFITPYGLYQFNVMPFGLQGAPATFQRLMDKVLEGLESFSAAYLDDIIIYSQSWAEHIRHVRKVLEVLRSSNLTVKLRKCQLGMDECRYLGHVVGNGKVKPGLDKVKAVETFPKPRSKKEVRGFLGLTGYYRRFISNYSTIAAPLSDLTRRSAPLQLHWTESCEEAFQTLKQALCQEPVLLTPDFEKMFTLQTDASDRGIGAVLSQRGSDGKEHPVAYFSKKLLPREERYATVEKECLAIKLGIEAFRVYLLGKPFLVQTDHKALMWMDRLKEGNARLTRWALALQPYTYTVVHRKGLDNGNADALSRISFENSVVSAGEGEGSVEDL